MENVRQLKEWSDGGMGGQQGMICMRDGGEKREGSWEHNRIARGFKKDVEK